MEEITQDGSILTLEVGDIFRDPKNTGKMNEILKEAEPQFFTPVTLKNQLLSGFETVKDRKDLWNRNEQARESFKRTRRLIDEAMKAGLIMMPVQRRLTTPSTQTASSTTAPATPAKTQPKPIPSGATQIVSL